MQNYNFQWVRYKPIDRKVPTLFQQIMNNSDVQLSRRFSKHKQNFKLLQEWGAWKINFANEKDNEIIRIIDHIDFPNLQYLNLRDNKFSSIEGIHRLNAPVLQYLRLDENKIMSVRDLTKANWNSLNILIISQNVINQSKDLWKIPFKLIKYYSQTIIIRKQNSDLRFIIKMQATDFQHLSSKNKIKEPRFFKTLKKKYSQFKIIK